MTKWSMLFQVRLQIDHVIHFILVFSKVSLLPKYPYSFLHSFLHSFFHFLYSFMNSFIHFLFTFIHIIHFLFCFIYRFIQFFFSLLYFAPGFGAAPLYHLHGMPQKVPPHHNSHSSIVKISEIEN